MPESFRLNRVTYEVLEKYPLHGDAVYKLHSRSGRWGSPEYLASVLEEENYGSHWSGPLSKNIRILVIHKH